MRPPDRIQTLRPVAEQRRADCPADRSPARPSTPACHRRAGQNLPVGSYYGEPRASWACACSPIRHSTRPRPRNGMRALLQRPRLLQLQGLVRPYRVGMSCGFCHVGPSPIAGRSREPEMGEHQRDGGLPVFLDRPHLRLGRPIRRTTCTSWSTPQRPGTLDTSLVSTDYINNPRTMNAIYNLAHAWSRPSDGVQERLAGAS